MKPDLTISIINHSNPRMLHECLRSLFAATHRVSLDVWVVDNATGGAGVPEIRAEFPRVRWLFNEQRLGFSANHNQVLRQAIGHYSCILNDDMVVHDGAFDKLLAYMKGNPAVGMAGARLLNGDGSQQNCTFRFMTLWSELVGICLLPGPLNRLKTIALDPAQKGNSPALVDWVLGACVVVRAETLRQVGLLDSETFPIANNEEVDWCLRARRAGWQVAYCPEAVLTHFAGQSQKPATTGPDKMRVEMHRTRIAFFRKHYGLSATSLLRLIYLATLPWNMAMLSQSAWRGKITPEHRRNALATLYGIAATSIR